ncbi:MAG TPA: protein kinase, partial [Thermoanaerobaculia bacterium]|nr:protein kinase [Thermoanaerobaculia bacterium]
GERLGGFEILSLLGRGGMGEVYRARDLALDREVALKVLSQSIAPDAQSLSRFEREARALGTLTNPHIAVLYGLERTETQRFLVMELVEGETLESRLAYGALPVDEALNLALQIACGLEAAHQNGIVHRDLKPSNVMIDDKGAVKLLDFGLAKFLPDAPAELVEDASALSTRSGVLLGTVPYMSPEQASGQPVDARTDIWSFGCFVYEMLTGTRAFDGESPAATLVAVLDREPDWERLPAETPPAMRKLLGRCLRKNVRDRLQSIGDARLELEERDSSPEARSSHRWVRALPWALAALLAILAAASWLAQRETRPSPAVTRASILLPAGHTVTGFSRSYPLAISSDGRRLAWVASAAEETQLYVQSLAGGGARALPGTIGARFPFFSPDGEWVGFWADGWLQKVPFAGGRPTRITEAKLLDYGATWSSTGVIIYGQANRGFVPGSGGLHRVPEGGGEPETLLAGEWLRYPRFLPDGRHLLLTKAARGTRNRTIQILDLETGKRRDLVSAPENLLQAFVLSTGHLVWGSGGSIVAAPLDLRTLTVTGAPVRVLEDVFEGTAADAVYFAVSEDGTLVCVPGGTDHALVTVDRAGNVEPLTSRRDAFRLPDLSPDGRLLAVAIDADPKPSDIWIYDLERATWRRLTSGHHSLFPVWTPDGKGVTFTSWRRGAGEPFAESLDGGPARPVLPDESRTGNNQWGQSWSPDGGYFVFGDHHPENGYDLWLLDAAARTTRPLLVTPFNEWEARVSPDGRWIAYASDETGRYEVYVRSFPDGRSQTAVSSSGGREPRWSSRGNEIFFVSGDRVMSVEVSTSEGFAAGEPKRLFRGQFGTGDKTYAVFPDASRFVMVAPDPRSLGDRFELILGWSVELARQVR